MSVAGIAFQPTVLHFLEFEASIVGKHFDGEVEVARQALIGVEPVGDHQRVGAVVAREGQAQQAVVLATFDQGAEGAGSVEKVVHEGFLVILLLAGRHPVALAAAPTRHEMPYRSYQ